MNPADHASRGISADGLLKQENWIKPPNFLFEPEDHWPTPASYLTERELFDNDPEVKKVTVKTIVTKSQELQENTVDINELFQHHSSLYLLKRSVAWILKIRKELLRPVRVKRLDSHSLVHDDSCDKAYISFEDLKEAERVILTFIQRQEFPTEINTLVSGNSSVSHGSRIRSLDPFLDAGLLRVGGRLHKSSFPQEMKGPVILPKDHHVSTLILKQIHQDLLHSGKNHMLAKLRERYWLIHAPSAIRKVISKCVTSSRAVYLEIAASLDTDSYIDALPRFIVRRGQVKKIRSDNGTNFVGAERELKKSIQEWNQAQIQSAILQKNVDCQFNPPAGSHCRGAWDKLIRFIRKAMNSVLKKQTLDDEGLHTLMYEIEYTDQHCDLEPLTPNHMLLMKRKPNLPPGVFDKTDLYHRRRWRQIQYMANLFWHHWVRKYLPLLQERQKWHDIKRNFQIGNIVLVVDLNGPRNS
ncbi:uncharacterized protein LOC134277820 [Saccostrea cucullata]|uniref:uncharacterized protein LOC134277820 n=1 Tax=Saccostrea cuccullata TaxID=36930 RepID=UPI002ED3183F